MDFIFKLIGFIYKVCFMLTLWIGMYLFHKIFMNLLKKYEMIGRHSEVLYWMTFIGFVYITYYIIRRLLSDKDEEKETQYETPKKQGNFSSLGNLDDRFGESVDPKTYKGR